VRRASIYIDGRGQQLGPPKTEGARGEHWLMPTVVALLAKRRSEQGHERAAAPAWVEATYEGEPVSLVFTNPSGGLVLRQTVAKVIKSAAKTAGITAELGTHAGRRTVVTTLFVDGDEALEDPMTILSPSRGSTAESLKTPHSPASSTRGTTYRPPTSSPGPSLGNVRTRSPSRSSQPSLVRNVNLARSVGCRVHNKSSSDTVTMRPMLGSITSSVGSTAYSASTVTTEMMSAYDTQSRNDLDGRAAEASYRTDSACGA
jgi:hypothetical protein